MEKAIRDQARQRAVLAQVHIRFHEADLAPPGETLRGRKEGNDEQQE